MATKVSESGLSFISSWSIYSDTIYKVERNFSGLGTYLGFFDGSVLSDPSCLEINDADLEPTTKENALSCLSKHLNKVTFKLLTDFGFEKFNQTQFDALVSLLTSDSRCDGFYDYFKNSELYTTLKADVADPSIPSLIANYVCKIPLSNSGTFYDLVDRRSAESILFSSGVYNNCSGLSFNEKVVDGIKVLY